MSLKSLSMKINQFYSDRYREMAGYHKPEPYPSLKEMVETLAALSDKVYGLYCFRREPMRAKISDEQRDELLERCFTEGARYADELLAQFDHAKPSEIAARLGIAIERPRVPVGGGRVLFAEYEEPSEIRVYQSAVANAQSAIEENNLESFFEGIDVEEVLIAHELYHWVEHRDKDAIFTLNYRVKLWRIGRFTNTAKLVSLSEITAMSFAKRLTGLPFSPNLFDVFLSYTYNQDAGGALYNEILGYAKAQAEDAPPALG